MPYLLKNSLVVCTLLATTACGSTQFEQSPQMSTLPSSLVSPTISSVPTMNKTSPVTLTPSTQHTSPVNTSNTPSQIKSPATNSTSLKKYSNELVGLSIQYPADGRIVENSNTSNRSSFIVSNIPDSKEMPGTVKWLEFQKNLPVSAYTMEIFIGEKTDTSKINEPNDQEKVSENNSSGFATLPKLQMAPGLPWNTCEGSVIPSTRYLVDNVEGFGGSLLSTPESGGFSGHSYCFRKNKPEDDMHYQQIMIRINEKDPSQKLNQLLFPTIHFK